MPVRARPALRIALLAFAATLVPAVIFGVYVSPTAVFMDDHTRDAQVTIGNAGDTPEEATVELRFGFPDVDSAGTPFIRFVDDPGRGFPSASAWIQAFPARVILPPHSQQVVRLLARPPRDLPDGEYWTRLVVTGSAAPVQVTGADDSVRANVNLVIRLVASVTYRKGHVTTGVEVRDLSADAEGDSLTVWAHLTRLGNAAYLGTADIAVVDTAGVTVRRWATGLAVYYPMRRRFSFPLDSLAPGDYKVRFRLRTERPDLPEGRVLPAPTVTDSVAVRVG